jgi:hypothetical protein
MFKILNLHAYYYSVDVSKVDRDLTNMTSKQKRAALEVKNVFVIIKYMILYSSQFSPKQQAESPELFQLLDDFKSMVDELKDRIEPAIEKVRNDDNLPSNGGGKQAL